ncbi:MAG: ATP-binding cassette domain-containing protein [Polyangiaceae bacterium]
MTTKYHFEQTLLTLEDVRVRCGERTILDGVCASVKNVTRPGVQQGQVIGVLGPSGIGKTQLFRVLAGLSRPAFGRVLLGSEQAPVECGRVGVVAQDYPLFAHHSVLANLCLSARLSGDTSARALERARELLERFGIAEQAEQFPALLSGGQRQRVAIAQQLLRKSSLLLMDEPFSGLDLRMIKAVCALINEVARHDELLTIIVTSHDVSALLSVADTIWLLGRPAGANPEQGARIVDTLDLMERGIAWEPEVERAPRYEETRRELATRFLEL